jgi:hypothetical protein
VPSISEGRKATHRRVKVEDCVATLANDSSNPPKIIGHAGWMKPLPPGKHGYHYWRVGAPKERGYMEKHGITQEQVDEWFEHYDLAAFEEGVMGPYDAERKRIMNGEPHWYVCNTNYSSGHSI